jgi:hypothetical protein
MPRVVVHAAIGALAIVTAVPFKPARADYIVNHAVLHCGDAGAIVRFGESHSSDFPVMLYDLPAELAERWSGAAVAPANRCRLSNGDLVTIRYARKQPRAYGRGGGDPPSFFSLWINNKKVISREDFDSEYTPHKILNSVSYAAGTISRCAYQTDETHRWVLYELPTNIPIVCSSQSIDLAALPADPFEMSDLARDAIGTISISATYNPAFCQQFVGQPSTQGYWQRIGSTATKEKEVLSFMHLNPELPFPNVIARQGNTLMRGGTAELDFDNDGRSDTVVSIPGPPGRGSNMLLVKPGPVTDEVIANIQRIYDWASLKAWARQNLWGTYSRETTSYGSDLVAIMPMRIQGITYVLATPHNDNETPSAILMRMNKNDFVPNQHDDWEPVCTFQLVEENF